MPENCDDVEPKLSEREFNYRLSRLNSRESSSISLASIASSASLVFLGLSPSHQTSNLTIPIIGILFTCFGFAYNEIICRTIQKEENDRFCKEFRWKKDLVKNVLRVQDYS